MIVVYKPCVLFILHSIPLLLGQGEFDIDLESLNTLNGTDLVPEVDAEYVCIGSMQVRQSLYLFNEFILTLCFAVAVNPVPCSIQANASRRMVLWGSEHKNSVKPSLVVLTHPKQIEYMLLLCVYIKQRS
mgnify:CR=1 FL=1